MSPAAVFDAPHSSEAPALAREFALAHTAHVTPELRSVIALLVSELVTNAYRHGVPPVRVSVRTGDTLVRICVADGGGLFEVPAMAEPDRAGSGGWGLGVLAAMATSWGIDELPSGAGKQVWFQLDV